MSLKNSCRALLILGISFGLHSCAVRSQTEIESLGTHDGQILGSHKGAAVCIHKFENGMYKISTPPNCKNPVLAPASEVTYDGSAFKNWLVEQAANNLIKLDMRYATSKIFPKGDGTYRITAPLYGKPRCFLHADAKGRLNAAAIDLSRRATDVVLVLLDCYRPLYVSQAMFQKVNDPKWVAPKSGHNKGGTIDLTLGSVAGGQLKLLDMGSEFDLFSSVSEYSARNITPQQLDNRKLLRDVMTKAGFAPYDSEWWHFSTKAHDLFLDLPL